MRGGRLESGMNNSKYRRNPNCIIHCFGMIHNLGVAEQISHIDHEETTRKTQRGHHSSRALGKTTRTSTRRRTHVAYCCFVKHTSFCIFLHDACCKWVGRQLYMHMRCGSIDPPRVEYSHRPDCTCVVSALTVSHTRKENQNWRPRRVFFSGGAHMLTITSESAVAAV